MKLISHPTKFICAVLVAAPLLSYATTHVTDLYEVLQGNVVITTQQTTTVTHVNNQYTYSPYGQSHNLNHPASVTSSKLGQSNYQNLVDQTRQPLSITHNQFGYTGQAQDPSTNLMMLGGFRNYAPGVGQFIQPDTYNTFTKTSINNIYAYGLGNPICNTDPSGHFALPWWHWDIFSYAMNGIGGIGGGLLAGKFMGAAASTLGKVGFGVWGALALASSAFGIIATTDSEDHTQPSPIFSAVADITGAVVSFSAVGILAGSSDINMIAKGLAMGSAGIAGISGAFSATTALDPSLLSFPHMHRISSTIAQVASVAMLTSVVTGLAIGESAPTQEGGDAASLAASIQREGGQTAAMLQEEEDFSDRSTSATAGETAGEREAALDKREAALNERTAKTILSEGLGSDEIQGRSDISASEQTSFQNLLGEYEGLQRRVLSTAQYTQHIGLQDLFEKGMPTMPTWQEQLYASTAHISFGTT